MGKSGKNQLESRGERCKVLGLYVIAIDARDEALSRAKECGAGIIADARSGEEKVVEQVKKVTGGHGADATLSVSNHDSAAATGAAVTKMHGKSYVSSFCPVLKSEHLFRR